MAELGTAVERNRGRQDAIPKMANQSTLRPT